MNRSTAPAVLRVAALVVAALLAGCGGAHGPSSIPAPSLGDPTLVTTDKGSVRGALTASARQFLGIPYAAPPTGSLRFAAPQPRAAWTRPQDATKAGPVCPQTGQTTTEDCLYLNVWTPWPASGSLPVYVFVHGGGFALGGGSLYDGTALATSGNVVVVTVNYRLGIYGFLANPALDDGSGNTGNYAIEDQQAALRWVKTNIAAFGGDPNTVTLGGESAGAMSTCMQLASPGANGLFARAVVESGPCAFNWQTLQQVETQEAGIPASLGCTGSNAQIAACLRSSTLSIPQVLSVQGSVPRATLFPTVGGADTPNEPRTALGKLPLLLGGNNIEAGFFITAPPTTLAAYESALQQVYGANAGAVEAQYPFASYPSGYLALADAQTDYDPRPGQPQVVWCLDVRTFQLQASTAAPIYAYEFNDPNAPIPNRPTSTGPVHTAELPYLFPGNGGAVLPSGSSSLTNAMLGYWTNFIRTGNPNGNGLPVWPAYHTFTDVLQLAPNAIQTGVDVNAEHKCSFWNSLGFAT